MCAASVYPEPGSNSLVCGIYISFLSKCYKSKLKCFIKLLNFLLFIELKTFKKFYLFGTNFCFQKLYRFGLFSKGFTVYFSMYFSSFFFVVERFWLYYKFDYFVKCFFEVFFNFFDKIKISNYCIIFMLILLLILSFNFIIFSLAKFLFIIAYLVDFCQ